MMSEKTYRLARDARVSAAGLEDLLVRVWAECRKPGTQSYELTKGIVQTPEVDLPQDVEQVVALRPGEQDLDPATGVLILASWVAGKVAEKTFDLLWDRVIAPRLNDLLGGGGVLKEENSEGDDRQPR